MKKLFFLILMSSSSTSFAQVTPSVVPVVPTGGCIGRYSIDINSIMDGWSPAFVLINGRKYSLKISLTSSMEDCEGGLQVTLSNKKITQNIGHLASVVKGDFTIPLDSFDLSPGIYDLTVQYQIKYPASTTAKVSVLASAGIGTIMKTEGISVYPVPASNVLNIDLSKSKTTAHLIRMTDMNGREVKMFKLTNANIPSQIPVDDLPPGIYIMQVQTTDNVAYLTISIVH